MIKTAMTTDMAWAILLYMERAGGAWPYGEFTPEGFFPDWWERRTCCADIHPEEMYQHCCSVKHISSLFSVDPTQLHQYFTEVKGDVLWVRARTTLSCAPSFSSSSVARCLQEQDVAT